MNINNTNNTKPIFTSSNIQLHNILNNKHSYQKQNKINGSGVILELTTNSKAISTSNIKDIFILEEKNHNNTLKIMEYSEELLNSTTNATDLNGKMMSMTEKYYKMINDLKEQYSNEEDFNYYKTYLDKAFNEQIKWTAEGVAAGITSPFIGLMRIKTSSISSKNNSSYIDYNNKLMDLRKKYSAKIYNDTINVFHNIRSYYDKYKNFDKITSDIISSNNKYMSSDDFSYIYNIKDDIDEKLITIKYSNEKNFYLTNDVKNSINNMSCSNFIRDMYNSLYEIALQNF